MASITFRGQMVLNEDDGSSKTTPFSYSLASVEEIYRITLDCAASSNVVIWDKATWTGFPLQTFDFAFIMANGPAILEWVVDDAGDVGEALGSVELKADVPFVLHGDNSYANHTVGFNGTVDAIEKLSVEEKAGTAAIQVKVILVQL